MNSPKRAVAALACAVAVVATAAGAPAGNGRVPRVGKVVARISIPQGSGGLAVGEGAVWTMGDAVSALLRIDPHRNAVIARTKVKPIKACAPFPSACSDVAAAEGAVWVSHWSDDTVTRIAPQTNSVIARIPVGPQPNGIAVSPGAVGVANAGGPSVSRIDPATNKVVATIRVGPARACCSEYIQLTVGGGSVWVAVPNLASVVRIDPATNAVKATIHLSGQPYGFLTADARTVWAAAAHAASAVWRIDPRTNRSSAGVKGPLMTPIGLALGFGSLWVADLDAKTIDRVNVRTGRIVARLRVGGYPVRLAVGFGSVWVRDDTGRVLRIRPQR
jgi:YVTN family beta-propeller protein